MGAYWITTTDDDEISRGSLSVDLAPDVSTSNGEGSASPRVYGARSRPCAVEGNAISEMSDPDLESSIASASAEQIMTSVADNESEATFSAKVDSRLDVCWGSGINRIDRNVSKRAVSCNLADRVVDRRACIFVAGVVQGDGVVTDEGGVRQLDDNLGAGHQVLLSTWIADDGWRLGEDELATEGGVEAVPCRI